MADADIQRYLDRIEMQHSVRPKYMAVVTELLEKLDSAHGIMKAVPELYNVETAVGVQLDVVGELVGVIRKDIPELIPDITAEDVEDDDLIRTIILCKIAQDNWDGTNDDLIDIWETTASRLVDIDYIDNQDMTVDVIVEGPVDYEVAKLLDSEYIIPKPMGVTMHTTVDTQNDLEAAKKYFGVALYGAVQNYLGETDEPDLSGIDPLCDETDAMLLDETWTLLEG